MVGCQEKSKQAISITLDSGILKESSVILEAIQDTPITLPNGEDLWKNEKYVFKGWQAKDSSTNYNSGSSFSSSTSTTLYAIWGDSDYIQYHPNGGEGDPFIKYFKETVTIAENTFTKEGYGFQYWNTTPDDTGTRFYPNRTYSFSDSGTRSLPNQIKHFSEANSITLYAIWKKKTIISYDSNGGTGIIPAQYCDIDKNKFQKLADGNTLKKDGYVFACWNTAADGSEKNYTIDNCYTNKEDITFYAQWVKADSDYSIGAYGNIHYQWFSYRNKKATEIIIPAYYKGRSVYGINSYGLMGCSKITSIVIPDTVKVIQASAFRDCSSLESVELPVSGCQLGSGVFYNCTSLKSVKNISTLYASDDGYNGIFEGCKNLSYIEIPEGIRKISKRCFSGCINLSSIDIPGSVTYIGDYAFENCKKITSITIPDNIESIGIGVFKNCTNLTSISLPDSVSPVSGVYQGWPGLTTLDIPSGTKEIPGNAFSYCRNLTSVSIPEGVTSIGKYAFQDCSKLSTVNIPNTIVEIGSSAFYNCECLTSIVIPTSVKSIGAYAFCECSGLTSVTLEDGVESIGEKAFFDCYKLSSISIPDSVKMIGARAFYCCSALSSIKLPNSIIEIEENTFYNCRSLKSIFIPEGIETLWNNVFSNCSGLQSVTLPASLTFIGSNAFDGCSKLMNITYSSTMEDWSKITLHTTWNSNSVIETITCTDGVITL